MMQDIVDLRNNNWVPRREDNEPNTLDKIHRKAAMQAKKTQRGGNIFQWSEMFAFPEPSGSEIVPDRRLNTEQSYKREGSAPLKRSVGSNPIL